MKSLLLRFNITIYELYYHELVELMDLRKNKLTEKRILCKLTRIFLLAGLLSTPLVLSAQIKPKTEQSITKLLDQTEAWYGTNDKLINGYIYLPINSRIDGHPYFVPFSEGNTTIKSIKEPGNDARTNFWRHGTVYVKGEEFSGKELKYNIELDDLILKATLSGGAQKLVRINSARIDSFRMGDHLFVHSRNYFSTDSIRAYFEEVYTGGYVLLTKYSKKFINQYTNLSPHGKYTGTERRHYLIKDGIVTEVSRRGNFLDHFKERRRAIKKFMRRHTIRYRKASTYELNQLMNYIDQNPSKGNEE